MNDYANFYRQIAEMEREAGRSNRRGRRSGAAWERTPEANRAPEVPRFSPEEVAQLERETAVERARQNARDAYSPLPDEFGPLVPMSAMAADLIQAPIDAAQASTGDAAAQRRLGARDERWRRGGERAGQDILAEGHGGQLMQFFSDLPGQMDEAEQARLEAGGRDTALDRVGSALGGFWTGMAAGPREARGEVAAQDEIRAQHRSDAAAAMERGDDVGARSAALSGRMAEREGDVSAGEDFWYNAPWAAEFIPGVGLLDVATSAGRFGARQGFRAAGQEIPEAIARPNRLSETQRVGPATENARGWRNNALLGGAAYLGADAADGELGDDPLASAAVAGGAMIAGRRLIPNIETAIPEDIQHLARQGELGPDGARNYTPNPRQRLTVDPEGRVAMDYEGSFNAGDGASVGEVRSLMRGAREALDDDIATTRRSEYSWTPNGESQARLYRNEFERNTPENYAFSETPQGEMRLRRLGAEFEPDTLPAERVADDAPFGFEGAPQTGRVIDAEATPAPNAVDTSRAGNRPPEPIDWEADIVPERSAMRDLGIGSRATERFDIGDASFRVEFDPDVAADAAVVNFRRVGQGRGGDGVNEYAPTGEAGLSAGRVFEQVQAAIRRDIAQNQRQRYGFNGETAQQRALYQRMARTTEPPAGYRWSGPDSAGMVFLERNAPSAGARRLDRGDTSAAVATIGAGGALLFGDEAAAEGFDPNGQWIGDEQRRDVGDRTEIRQRFRDSEGRIFEGVRYQDHATGAISAPQLTPLDAMGVPDLTQTYDPTEVPLRPEEIERIQGMRDEEARRLGRQPERAQQREQNDGEPTTPSWALAAPVVAGVLGGRLGRRLGENAGRPLVGEVGGAMLGGGITGGVVGLSTDAQDAGELATFGTALGAGGRFGYRAGQEGLRRGAEAAADFRLPQRRVRGQPLPYVGDDAVTPMNEAGSLRPPPARQPERVRGSLDEGDLEREMSGRAIEEGRRRLRSTPIRPEDRLGIPEGDRGSLANRMATLGAEPLRELARREGLPTDGTVRDLARRLARRAQEDPASLDRYKEIFQALGVSGIILGGVSQLLPQDAEAGSVDGSSLPNWADEAGIATAATGLALTGRTMLPQALERAVPSNARLGRLSQVSELPLDIPPTMLDAGRSRLGRVAGRLDSDVDPAVVAGGSLLAAGPVAWGTAELIDPYTESPQELEARFMRDVLPYMELQQQALRLHARGVRSNEVADPELAAELQRLEAGGSEGARRLGVSEGAPAY